MPRDGRRRQHGEGRRHRDRRRRRPRRCPGAVPRCGGLQAARRTTSSRCGPRRGCRRGARQRRDRLRTADLGAGDGGAQRRQWENTESAIAAKHARRVRPPHAVGVAVLRHDDGGRWSPDPGRGGISPIGGGSEAAGRRAHRADERRPGGGAGPTPVAEPSKETLYACRRADRVASPTGPATAATATKVTAGPPSLQTGVLNASRSRGSTVATTTLPPPAST